MDRPHTRTSKVVGALIGAIAALSIGGVGFAFARDATDSPTTDAPAATAPDTPPAEGEGPSTHDDCPDHAGPGVDGTARTGATSTGDAQV